MGPHPFIKSLIGFFDFVEIHVPKKCIFFLFYVLIQSLAVLIMCLDPRALIGLPLLLVGDLDHRIEEEAIHIVPYHLELINNYEINDASKMASAPLQIDKFSWKVPVAMPKSRDHWKYPNGRIQIKTDVFCSVQLC